MPPLLIRRLHDWRFNNAGLGGRPKGTRNLLQKRFLEELCADFELHGAGAIKICRLERPNEYLKIVASILPKELIVESGILADLSDEELAAHIDLLQKMCRAAGKTNRRSGNTR